MFLLKFLLTVILSFQVSTYVLAQNNVTDEAQEALTLLSNQIDYAFDVVANESIKLFLDYQLDINRAFRDYLQADTNNFRYVLGNISVIAVNVNNGRECITLLLNSSGFTEDIFTADEEIAQNIFESAILSLSDPLRQFVDLNATFDRNCIQNKNNCEGRSRAIIAEVERLLPSIKRIPVEALTEMHVFGYKLAVDLENAHAELMEIYNKAVQNMTLCVSANAKLMYYIQDSDQPLPSGSISDLFEDLVTIIEFASATASVNIVLNEDQVIRQSTTDYLGYIKGVNTAISRANSTINSLIETAQEYNLTLDCAIPDLSLIANSSYERVVKEFQLLVNDTLVRLLERGIQDVKDIGEEIHFITLEIEGCVGDTQCDYLAEKIAVQQSEIPWKLQQATNSTIVLLQQSVTAVRESGARVVRDTQEQLEVGIIDLKSCIQNSA